MSTVLITGSSGYLGTQLCRRLQADKAVETIVGIDLGEPQEAFSKLRFFKLDCLGDMEAAFSPQPIDSVVHLVYVLNMTHNKNRMRRINVGSLENVLEHCHNHAVGRLVVTSSTTAYGAHADNPVPLTEADPLRATRSYQYAYDKIMVEARLSVYQDLHPDCDVVVARPAIVLGPHAQNFLGRYVDRKIIPWTTPQAPMQLLHEEDIANALHHLITQAPRGIYNVGPPEGVDLVQVLKETGRIVISLPSWLLRPLTQLAWWLRLTLLTEAPGAMVDYIRHSWTADGSKIERETGFNYRHTSRQALESFLTRDRDEANR